MNDFDYDIAMKTEVFYVLQATTPVVKISKFSNVKPCAIMAATFHCYQLSKYKLYALALDMS